MTRVMYDAVDPANIPAIAKMVIGYIDGTITGKNYEEQKARFPNALIVPCTVLGDPAAPLVDYETGNLSEQGLKNWFTSRLRSLKPSTVYCNKATQRLVVTAFRDALLPMPKWFIADPTNVPHMLPNTVATQWGWKGGYDISWVADYWPGVDPFLPAPAPAPVPTFGGKVSAIVKGSTNTQYITDGITKRALTNQEDLSTVVGLGLVKERTYVTVPDTWLNAIPTAQ